MKNHGIGPLDDFGLGRNVMFTGYTTSFKVITSAYLKRVSTFLKYIIGEANAESVPSDSDSEKGEEQEVHRVHGRSNRCRRCGQSFIIISAVKENYVMCKVPTQCRLLSCNTQEIHCTTTSGG